MRLHKTYIGAEHVTYKRKLLIALVLCVSLLVPSMASAAPAAVLPVDRVNGVTAGDLGVPNAAMPQVALKAGALVTEDGRVLWTRRPRDRRAMASITKLMTAVLAVENAKPEQLVTIPRTSTMVGESTSYLVAGEKLPMSELIQALLVHSGNDAAIAIAEHVSGSEEAFVELMNTKAAELGLSRTHFANPHGLDQANHYSTAEDVSVLARYAMTKSEIRDVVGMKTVRIGRGPKLQSTNLLIGNYRGANGVKTGWTNQAGYSVVESARRDGVELYAVVLGSSGELTRFKDGRELLDWGFAHYRPQLLSSKGTVVGEAVVTDYLDRTVPGEFSQDASATVFDLAGPIRRKVSMAAVKAPIAKGQRIGVVQFAQGDQTVASVPLVASQAVEAPGIFERGWIGTVRLWRKMTGGPLTATVSNGTAVSY